MTKKLIQQSVFWNLKLEMQTEVLIYCFFHLFGSIDIVAKGFTVTQAP